MKNESTALTEIHFAEGIEEIGQGAFVGCVALTHLEFPKTLVKIHHSAFAEWVSKGPNGPSRGGGAEPWLLVQFFTVAVQFFL